MSKLLRKNKILMFLVTYTLMINTLSIVNVFADESSSSTPPAGYQSIDTAPVSLFKGLAQMADSPQILLIQDVNPWSATEHYNMLQSMGELTKISSANAITTNFAEYDVVILANDQYTSTYNNYAGFKSNLEAYAANGGVVIFGASDRGWNSGTLSADLPGGLKTIKVYQNNNVVSDYSHNIVTGDLTDSASLTDSDLYSTYCSHTSLFGRL